jgi:hypothetical protein
MKVDPTKACHVGGKTHDLTTCSERAGYMRPVCHRSLKLPSIGGQVSVLMRRAFSGWWQNDRVGGTKSTIRPACCSPGIRTLSQ